MKAKIAIRNIKYWTSRLIFDWIFKRYKDVDVQITEEDLVIFNEFCMKEEMVASQAVEHILKEYIRDKKNFDKVFGDTKIDVDKIKGKVIEKDSN